MIRKRIDGLVAVDLSKTLEGHPVGVVAERQDALAIDVGLREQIALAGRQREPVVERADEWAEQPRQAVAQRRALDKEKQREADQHRPDCDRPPAPSAMTRTTPPTTPATMASATRT